MAGRRQHGEGSVYQRGSDGLWVATVDLGWRDGKRDRREFAGKTPAAAMEKRERFQDLRRDGFTVPKGRQPYVSEWMLHWLHNIAKRRVAATTWEASYRQKVTDHICPYFERTLLHELSEEDIEDWHRHLEQKISERTHQPLSAATIGQTHRIFSTGIKSAVARGKLPRNPLSNVTPPAPEEIELEPPTAAETLRLLDACREWPNGARWIVAITTGLRQGEALALTWPDIRLDPPASVTVRLAAARLRGQRITKPPKSLTSRRRVPLPARAVVALRAHRELAVRGLGEDLVFRAARGGPVHPKVDYNDWMALLASLGLPHYRVHDCRHGYATALLESGQDPRVVQDLLGHSTGVLLKRYQHVRQVMHDRAATALDEVFGE